MSNMLQVYPGKEIAGKEGFLFDPPSSRSPDFHSGKVSFNLVRLEDFANLAFSTGLGV
jgi:hypothetical protein